MSSNHEATLNVQNYREYAENLKHDKNKEK